MITAELSTTTTTTTQQRRALRRCSEGEFQAQRHKRCNADHPLHGLKLQRPRAALHYGHVMSARKTAQLVHSLSSQIRMKHVGRYPKQ